MKTKTTLLLLFISIAGFSQEKKNQFGVHIAAGSSILLRTPLTGSAGYNSGHQTELEVSYARTLAPRLKLESGINWRRSTLTISPNLPPGSDVTPRNYSLNLIYIPVFLRYNFSRYVYFNHGFIADIDINSNKQITNQTGIGAGIGLGGEIPLSQVLKIQINPYIHIHRLIGFDHDTYPQKLLDTGIRVGVVF